MNTSLPLRANLQLPIGLPEGQASATRTEDGTILSVIFDKLKVENSFSEAAPSVSSAVVNFEVPLQAHQSESRQLVRVEARGHRAVAGSHSWAHAVIWINGQRFPIFSTQAEVNENYYAALCLDINGKTALNVSVTLLAQCDASDANSAVQIVLDTLDFSVVI